MSRWSCGRLETGVRAKRYSKDCVKAILSLTMGPVAVIRGVADSMPQKSPRRFRGRTRRFCTVARKALKFPVTVSRVDTAPVSLPYSGSYGFAITFTESTTSMGRLIAALPVTGSATLGLLTRDPLCDARAPFMLIRPSGPRTTPGIKGSNASTRSCLFGAFKTVDLFMTDWSDEYVETGGS